MKNNISTKVRFLAMLLCALLVINSFSYVTTLIMPVEGAFDKTRTKNLYFKDDIFYNKCSESKDLSDIYWDNTETGNGVYKGIGDIIKELKESVNNYTFIRIYMFSTYYIGASYASESTLIDGYGITQIIRASTFCAKPNADGTGWDPESGGHLLSIDANYDGNHPQNNVKIQNIEINGLSGGIGIDNENALPTYAATKAAVSLLSGELVLGSGTIIRNNYNISTPSLYADRSLNGGGIYVAYSKEKPTELVIESNVQIRGNVACGSRRGFGGGGIFCEGKIIMNGGLIIRNRSINKGEIDEENGDLSGGGGIMLFSGEITMPKFDNFTPATLIMNGGRICENYACLGGGIFSVGEYALGDDKINDSYVKIGVGTEICHNVSSRAGGGIYMGRNSKLILDGGKVHDNICTLSAASGDHEKENLEFTGGVFFNGDTLELHGGSIYNNTAVKNADFCYFTSDDPEKSRIIFAMFGEDVGWKTSTTAPMQGYTQVQVDIGEALLSQEGIQVDGQIKIKYINTARIYPGVTELKDFYTDNNGMLYLWLQTGEKINSVTIVLDDGREFVLTDLTDARTKVTVHYNKIAEGRRLMAKLENPPEGYLSIEYKWMYRDIDELGDRSEWKIIQNSQGNENLDNQWMVLSEDRILHDEIKVIITAYSTADKEYGTDIGTWESNVLCIRNNIVIDDETSSDNNHLVSDTTKMPDVGIYHYARLGTQIETFDTGAKNLYNVSTNGSFTIHYEFDHFYYDNFTLLIYAMHQNVLEGVAEASGRGATMPAGTRLLLVDKCCCVDDTNEVIAGGNPLSIKELTHNTETCVYYYTFTGTDSDKKFLSFNDFQKIGHSVNVASVRDKNCRGYSRYQLIVILPEDWDGKIQTYTGEVTTAGIDIGFVHNEDHTSRILGSFSKVYTTVPDGGAEASPKNSIVQDENGTYCFSNADGAMLTLNTSGTDGTVTVIEADKSFPYGTVISCDYGDATIIDNCAFFPYMLSNQTVTINGLLEETYNITVYSSRAKDILNPLKAIDIIAKTESIPILITRERVTAQPQPPEGVEMFDWRFIPKGQTRDIDFIVQTTGLGVDTGGLIEVAVCTKKRINDNEFEYIVSEEFDIIIDQNNKTVRVSAKPTAEIGTYHIIFTYGDVKYIYDIIVHK